MKRGIPEHPKTKILASLLDIELAQAVGHLEMLQHFTKKFCPSGDIGQWPFDVVAKHSGWYGIPEDFIYALIISHVDGGIGFLIKAQDGRILVPDWWC